MLVELAYYLYLKNPSIRLRLSEQVILFWKK